MAALTKLKTAVYIGPSRPIVGVHYGMTGDIRENGKQFRPHGTHIWQCCFGDWLYYGQR